MVKKEGLKGKFQTDYNIGTKFSQHTLKNL